MVNMKTLCVDITIKASQGLQNDFLFIRALNLHVTLSFEGRTFWREIDTCFLKLLYCFKMP